MENVRSDPTLVPLQMRESSLCSCVYKRLNDFLTSTELDSFRCYVRRQHAVSDCIVNDSVPLQMISSALWQDNSHRNYAIRDPRKSLNENASIQEVKRVAWPVASRKSRYFGRLLYSPFSSNSEVFSATKPNRSVCGVLMVLERWVNISFHCSFLMCMNCSVRGRRESQPEEECRRRGILLMKVFQPQSCLPSHQACQNPHRRQEGSKLLLTIALRI